MGDLAKLLARLAVLLLEELGDIHPDRRAELEGLAAELEGLAAEPQEAAAPARTSANHQKGGK